MAFQNKLQSLISTHTNNSGNSQQCRVDWSNGIVWQYGPASSDLKTYLTKFDIPTGGELAFQQNTAYPGSFREYPVGLDASGLYVSDNVGSTMHQIDATTLLQTQANTIGVTFPQGTLSSIEDLGGSPWQIVTGLTGVSDKFTLVRTDLTPLTPWSAGAISYGGNLEAYSCGGIPGQGIGYILTYDFISSSAANCLLYKVDVNAITHSVLATILPTDIDAGWTKITSSGLFLDRTDGNICACFYSNTGGSSFNYIAKYDATTGSQIWLSPLPGLIAGPGAGGNAQMSQSNITRQIYCLFIQAGSTNYLITINTSDGSITTSTTGLVGLTGGISQCFNDSTGAIVGEFHFIAGTGSPVQLNATPSTYAGWSVLYVAPPNPTPATGTHASYTRIWGNLAA